MEPGQTSGLERYGCGATFSLASVGVRTKQRILYDILSVCDRSGHPGTVPMQLRPELADGFEKRQIPNVELTCVFRHVFDPGSMSNWFPVPVFGLVRLSLTGRDQAPQAVVDIKAPCV